MKYFGGIEGGATHSTLHILDETGQMCATARGPGTNHWMVGIPEVATRIVDMVERAKTEADIPLTTPLTSLGLSLSGCEQEKTNKELEHELQSKYPNISQHYVICSDTMGSIYTVSAVGGVVVISGTGSNALLLNPDKKTFSCGGWGHFLGDEGSAFFISFRAVKIIFDHMDNREQSQCPTDTVWQIIKEHFQVENRLDLLPHCYDKFDKPFFASLCKKLAKSAEAGDSLSQYLFTEAGHNIAGSILALLPKVDKELVKEGHLNIVCVGSVWQSWHLLREGFLNELLDHPLLFDLKLIKITKSMSYGACYMAADNVQFPMPRNYIENYEELYFYSSKTQTNNFRHSHAQNDENKLRRKS